MNITHLEYFIEIVHQKSINKAAKNLFINRSSLMTALNSLESEIGVPLLYRNSQGVTLTDKGKEVYEGTIKILEIVENWRHLSIENNDETVNFTISALPAINTIFIPHITTSFKKNNSNCSFTIKGINNSLEDLLNALNPTNAIIFGGLYSYGKIDKESFLHLLNRQHYMLHYLFSSQFVVYCNIDNPLAKEDFLTLELLQKQQLVTLSEISNIANPISSLSLSKIPHHMLTNQQIFSTLENDKSLVAFLPNVFEHQQIISKKIVTRPVIDYITYINYFLAYQKTTAKSPISKQFINHILHFSFIS